MTEHCGERFDEAIRRFDEANSHDPNTVKVGDESWPRELIYSRWVTDWVLRLSAAASEALLLAARSQHLCRWTIPRESYAMDRAGYLRWREDLKKFHARKAAAILSEVGYPQELILRVSELNLKQNLAMDPECQTLEDALCLVTLEHQLTELMEKTPPEKMVGILQKTWKKMSPAAREQALGLSYSPEAAALIQKAVTPAESPES